jgi:hypothetical protein
MLTFGSMPWMFPHEVQEDNHYSSKLYASMNNGETTFPVKMVEVEMQNGSVYAPNNKDVLNGEFFNRIDGDGRLKILQKNIDRWYKNDKNLFDHNVLTPFVPPKGIDHVISVYGVNVPTPVGARYKEQEGFFEEVELITNDGGRVTSSLTSRSAIPKSRSYRTRQSGDGTVPYASLSWAFSFFDENIPVNLTMVPSHRSYEEDDILTFENVGENLTSLMKSKEHNRFFVQRSIGVSRRTGLPKLKTTQVWEIQGVAHRDSVTDSRVLEQLRSVLLKNKKMKRKLRDIRTESRRDLEQSVMSLMRQDMIYDVVLEHAAWSHDKQPESDDACFWDYAKVRCAWARYCEYVSLSLSLSLSLLILLNYSGTYNHRYQYKLGDVHLSQSCRLRDKPLPHDFDLEKDNFELTMEKTTKEIISHRYVYFDDDFKREFFHMEPWLVVTLISVGSSMLIALCSCIVFRFYHVEVVKALKRYSHALKNNVSNIVKKKNEEEEEEEEKEEKENEEKKVGDSDENEKKGNETKKESRRESEMTVSQVSIADDGKEFHQEKETKKEEGKESEGD